MTTSSIVYEAIIKHCEELEREKKYIGNGHHLAQRLAEMVKDNLEKRELVIVDKSLLAAIESGEKPRL